MYVTGFLAVSKIPCLRKYSLPVDSGVLPECDLLVEFWLSSHALFGVHMALNLSLPEVASVDGGLGFRETRRRKVFSTCLLSSNLT